jgi:hypothetical protein
MKTYKSLISEFGFSALALAVAVGFVVAASISLAASTKCWCCLKDKKVAYMLRGECQKGGGECYGKESEAIKHCRIQADPNN